MLFSNYKNDSYLMKFNRKEKQIFNDDFDSFIQNKNNREFMIEKKISSDEYTAAILNNKVLPIIKIVPSNEFYDFDAKYKSDETKFFFPELESEMVSMISDQVMKSFEALGCKTWARVDFVSEGEKLAVIEINSVPGFTAKSLFPLAAKYSGIEYKELISLIIEDC